MTPSVAQSPSCRTVYPPVARECAHLLLGAPLGHKDLATRRSELPSREPAACYKELTVERGSTFLWGR